MKKLTRENVINELNKVDAPNIRRILVFHNGEPDIFGNIRQYIPINQHVRDLVNQAHHEDLTGSDAQLLDIINTDEAYKYYDIETTLTVRSKKSQKQAAMLKYLAVHKKYSEPEIGLYSSFKPANYNKSCIIQTLEKYIDVQEANLFFHSRFINSRSLKEFAEKNSLYITLKYRDRSGKTHKNHYAKNDKEPINIGLIEDHYFPIYNVKKSNGIKNTFDLLEYYIKASTTLGMNLIRPMKPEELIKIGKLDKSFEINLNGIEFNSEQIEYIERNCNNEHIFCDFECVTNGDRQESVLICAVDNQDNKYTAKNFTGILDQLNNGHYNFYFHNAKYDFNFIVRDNITITNYCTLGAAFINAKFIYKFGKVNITGSIIDTFKFMTKALKKLPELVGLPNIHKEMFDTNLFDKKFTDKRYLSKEDTTEEFYNHAYKMFPVENPEHCNTFDLLAYLEHYCYIDCIVLRDCFTKFRELLKIITGLDAKDYLTISSVGYEYIKKEGCFEGIHDTAGLLKHYQMDAIVGGRVMTKLNKMYITNELIALDANSLYPSAMAEMPGIPIGIPKVIGGEIPLGADYYIVRIKITKIGEKLDFPMISYKDDDTGNRNWSNDIVNKTITIGKIGLEDLIEFHKIEYELVDGIYYDEGLNTKISSLIKDLYVARNTAKKNGNVALSDTIKLLMNSIYGKSIMKPRTTKKFIKNKTDFFDTYIINNFEKVESAVELNNTKMLVTIVEESGEDYNCPLFGIIVLEMSKRIMNRTMYKMEKLNMDMYYQDTDSIFLRLESYNINKEHFNTIIGDDLGQFKLDLGIDIVAKRAIFLGKKSYYTKLSNGKEKIALKGIPLEALDYYVTKNKITREKFFELLYSGKSITIDLTCDGTKTLFDFTDLTVFLKTDFKRTLKFV